MAIIRRNLGNNKSFIIKKFREIYPDGLGGLRFSSFVNGWKAAWDEMKELKLLTSSESEASDESNK